MCFAPQRRALFRNSTSEPPKVVRTPGVLYILTWKCASRHNGVHFFKTQLPKVVRAWCALYIFTSKCASRHNGVHFFETQLPKVVREPSVFNTFDLEMCFAPQRRALFSPSQTPKAVRSSGVLSIFTSKCVSRHNGVQFFISHLASWLRTRRFSEPTFRPSRATNHWKNTVNPNFPIFSRICIFFLLIFSLLTLLTSAFQLSILSEVSLLNFLRQCSTGNDFVQAL